MTWTAWFERMPDLELWRREEDLSPEPWKQETKEVKEWRRMREPRLDGGVTLIVCETLTSCGVRTRSCPFCSFFCNADQERTFRHHTMQHAQFYSSPLPDPTTTLPLEDCIKLYPSSDDHLILSYFASSRKSDDADDDDDTLLVCSICQHHISGADRELNMRRHMAQQHIQMHIFVYDKRHGCQSCYFSPYLPALYE
jgi:hypothetical protein